MKSRIRIDKYGNANQLVKQIPNPDDWDKYRYTYVSSIRSRDRLFVHICENGEYILSYFEKSPTPKATLVKELDYTTMADSSAKVAYLLCVLKHLPVFKDYPSYWNF